MDILSQLDYPLPVLSLDIDSITIETSGCFSGGFQIKNTGGSILNGRILSNIKALTFTPAAFSQNTVAVAYSFQPGACKPGDAIQSSVVIMSNGGAKTLPLSIRITPPALETKEGNVLASLKDFAAYAKQYPTQAQRLFAAEEFADWLRQIGYANPEIYEIFGQDSIKSRGMDNFLIWNKLKNKASITFTKKQLTLQIRPGERHEQNGFITLQKNGWGYAEDSLNLTVNEGWLRLSAISLTAADFDEHGLCAVQYWVTPGRMPRRTALDKITLANSGGTLAVTAQKPPYLRAILGKETYAPEGSGVIRVTNHSGQDMTLDIASPDPYVKLEGRKYLVGAYAEIPFSVKITALQSAQFSLKRQPSLQTAIHIDTTVEGGLRIHKTLTLTINLQKYR